MSIRKAVHNLAVVDVIKTEVEEEVLETFVGGLVVEILAVVMSERAYS